MPGPDENGLFSPKGDPKSGTGTPDLGSPASDLGESSVETLQDYMLGTVSRVNKYTPPDLPKLNAEVSTKESLSTPSTTPIDNTSNAFLKEALEEAAAYFENTSGGGDPETREGGFFTEEVLQALIDKTSQIDGHEILAEIESEGLNGTFLPGPEGSGNDVAPKTSDVLKTNRFSPGGNSPYVQDADYSDGMFSLQKSLGRYDPDADAVAFKDIAKISLSSILAAAGAGSDQRNPDSETSTSQIGTGILTQLGDPFAGKVPVSELRAKAAKGFPGGVGQSGDKAQTEINQPGIRRKGDKQVDLDARNSESYGQLNTYLEPFGGPLPTGMIVLAALAGIAVLVAGIVLAAILTLIFLLFPPGQAEEPPEPLPMGAAKGQKDFGTFNLARFIFRVLRLPKIRSGRSFIVCMFYGVVQFYSRILDAISSGYFIVVSRAAIRDLEQIENAMASADFSNIVGALESIFVVFEAFGTSTTFQFLNTMVMLGDIVALSGGLGGGGNRMFSSVSEAEARDATLPLLGNIHTRNRTFITAGAGNDFRQATRFGSLPSSYLQPTTAIRASLRLGDFRAASAFAQMPFGVGATSQDSLANKWSESEKIGDGGIGRIDPSVRMDVEDRLDAYYMPFYFHDLRTNEIIALHAFVEGLQDSFNPKYNEVKGFGRMDPVQIYEGTERKIGLTFYVVATGERDFDEMYYAINRLVAMVYPQYSRGTQKSTADGETFIMPFSQVPTASPLIRMRLGNLFRSNYTLYSLSRLFGVGGSSFTIGAQDETESGEVIFDQAEKIVEDLIIKGAFKEKLIEKMRTLDDEPDAAQALMAQQDPTGMMGTDKGFQKDDPVIVGPSGLFGGYRFAENIGIGQIPAKSKGKFKVKSKDSDEFKKGIIRGYFVTPIVSADSEDAPPDKKETKKRSKVRYIVEFTHQEQIDMAKAVHFDATSGEAETGMIICSFNDLQFDYQQFTQDSISDELAPPDTGGIPNPFAEEPAPTTVEVAAKVVDFFNPENNSIVRSFNEAGGKGLAGVITQLDMDWNQAEWDIGVERRAPTYCKISMGFAPIHDLPIGLDADGIMTAPAYNVGNLVRSLFGYETDLERLEKVTQDQAAADAAAGADTGEVETAPAPDPT